MVTNLKQRLSAFVDSMSPRGRQWVMVGAISGGAVGLLWAVFAMGSGDTKPTSAATSKGDLKPTNIDLMAPGSQVKDVETWVGKAGRKLDQYENDREEQRRLNREQAEAQAAMMRRFAELEARLKSAPLDPAKAASAPAPTPAA